MTRNKMHLSILTMNVNAQTKRYRIANWVKKQAPTIYSLQKTHFTQKVNTGLESKDGEWLSKQTDPTKRQEKLYSYMTKLTSD
jgi:hypothetical protein